MGASTRSLSAGSLMLALLSSPVTAASYSLVETWQGKNFLDYFNFHVGSDPTNGYVNYLDKGSAESAGLVKLTDSGSVYLGVDHTTTLDPNGKGRDSVRIGSKKYYDQSLVIADIAHMPGSVCGTWPAFWSVGKEWPGDGEIDIIEGVNLQDHNEIVMHTAGTCSLTDTDMTGTVNATGCGEDLGTVGCVIEGHKGSYGTSFNGQGGGVYAMEWTDDYLKIWYFPRSSIPASIKSGKPDVTQFGTPMALVQESCDVANAFKSQSFIFDVTFCGDWAGGVFGNSGCPATNADSFQSCHNYVANHPAVFKETYWEINSVKIYQTGVKGIASVSSSGSQPTTVAAPVVSKTQAAQTEPATAVQSATTAVAPVVSETTVRTQGVATPAVAPSSSTDHVSIGTIQELNPASDTIPTATAESNPTENEEHTTIKKTRTITAYVTATTTICPEAEKSSSIVAHPSAVIVPYHSHGSAPPVNQQSAPVTTTVAPGAYTWSEETAFTPTANSGAPSSPVQPALSAAPSGPASSAENFGASWAQPSALPSAIVSSVSYDASRAGKSAPTDVSPASASNANSGIFVPSGSQSGVSPVFTGAASRFSTSISAVVCALAIAVLA
ncbi:uncharacterized protein N7529_010599 [Penicillium soppii]|uniref:uncharacterized protein n=1 Tax=Penicillium soppii TaxID=69789 RepID=UPI0025483FAC|nr:uncharacterized protein N7529_010599 [Penicillium soppii]KAJ5856655.1 hypothetical protein N7529_010599 [Penicillium soppii]